MEFVLSAEAREGLLSHARLAYPDECVGVLIGVGSKITHTAPLANQSPRPRTGFKSAPAQLARVFDRAHRSGREAIGIYHSHPEGIAVPSPRDHRGIPPHCLCLILSCKQESFELRGYMKQSMFQPLEEVLVSEPMDVKGGLL